MAFSADAASIFGVHARTQVVQQAKPPDYSDSDDDDDADGDDDDRYIFGSLKEGDYFGHVAIMAAPERKRTASVRAKGEKRRIKAEL